MANLQQVWLPMTMEKKESYTQTCKHTIYHYTENRHELEEISLNEINYIIHFWLAKTLSEMCCFETKHVITLHFQNIWVHLWGHMAFAYTKKICKHFSAMACAQLASWEMYAAATTRKCGLHNAKGVKEH